MGRMPPLLPVQFPCRVVDFDGNPIDSIEISTRTAVERRVAALLPSRRHFIVEDADDSCVASTVATKRGPYRVRWFTWPFEE